MDLQKLFKNFENLDQKEVKVTAWTKSNRLSGKLGFLEINDGTHLDNVQVVYKKNIIENFDEVASLRLSSAVEIKGMLKLTPSAKQPFEIAAEKIEILKTSDEKFPLQAKEQSLEFLREIAHIRAKTNYFNAIFKIRSNLSFYIHEYFNANNFVYLQSPIITANDAEGAGESFTVTTIKNDKYDQDFFGKKASLTVSGQLQAESYAQAFKNVYTFGPTFRAENSNTSRHAAEFWMIEPEVAFSDLKQNMDLAEDLLKSIVKKLFVNNINEINLLSTKNEIDLETRFKEIIEKEFFRITYTEAIDILQKAVKSKKVSFEINDINWGMDLQSEHERYICETVYNAPVFVTDYPSKIKAFYMKQNADNKTVAACDLLVPGVGELIGGSQREDDYQKLVNKAKEFNIDEKDLSWYFELRNFGYASSAGFGLGFERLIMYLTGVSNIRDVIAFPRTPKNIKY